MIEELKRLDPQPVAAVLLVLGDLEGMGDFLLALDKRDLASVLATVWEAWIPSGRSALHAVLLELLDEEDGQELMRVIAHAAVRGGFLELSERERGALIEEVLA